MTTTATEPITVLFIDDHKVVIDGLSSLLRDDSQIQVRGVFTSGEAALRFIETERNQHRMIDVIVSDLRMRQGMSGLEFALQLRTRSPQTRLIILSMSDEPADISAAIRLGVSGYLSKSQDVSDVRKAIYEVMRDNSRPYLSQEILRSFAEGIDPQTPDEVKHLTPRELEILKLIANEQNTAQIAEQLFISEATVDTHRRNMIQKLGVRSIVGLANFAIRNGLA